MPPFELRTETPQEGAAEGAAGETEPLGVGGVGELVEAASAPTTEARRGPERDRGGELREGEVFHEGTDEDGHHQR